MRARSLQSARQSLSAARTRILQLMQQPDARSISIAIQRHDQPGAFWKGSDQVTTDSGPRSRRMGFAAEPKWMRWSSTIATKPAMTTMRNFRTAGASHSLQNSRKISFYKSMGEFKLAAPRTDEVEGSRPFGQGRRRFSCLTVPCCKSKERAAGHKRCASAENQGSES
jgi:hypothetical protein